MMAEQPPNRDEPRWLLTPPAPGEAHVHIAVDEAAVLTPELREAIEGVMRALQSAEVEAYAKPQPCPALQNCTPQDSGECWNWRVPMRSLASATTRS